jgi:predicted adenylyl cyclase CyaB
MELEAKILLEKDEMQRLIALLGEANFIGQENILYKTSNGFVRIRTEGEKVLVTAKGRRLRGKYNSREEIEFEPDLEKDEVLKLFSIIGLGQGFYYTKKRANYTLDNCIVSLDILNDDQRYVEIEGSNKGIQRVIEKLGLADKEIERRSYLEILDG